MRPVVIGLFPDHTPTKLKARFNVAGTCRFSLEYRWEQEGKLLPWIMLNPSIAGSGQTKDNLDPTLRRVKSFTMREEKYSGFVVFNLFSLVSTDPAGLASEDPGAFMDDLAPYWQATEYELFVAAWGAHPLAVSLAA